MRIAVPGLSVSLSVCLALSAWLTACDKSENGFQPISNGKDLAGWSGDFEIWSVQDGAITGQTTEKSAIRENAFLVWRGGNPSNFELRTSVRMVARNTKNFANSGIYYRSRVDPASQQVLGYQGDIDASLPEYLGALYEDNRTTMAKSGQRVRAYQANGSPQFEVTGETASAVELAPLFAELAAGHWLKYVIIAQGNHLRHYVNGVLTAEVTDEDPGSPKSGVIALQVHHGEPMLVQFKDLRIKTLP